MSGAYERWVADARVVRIEDEIERRGIRLNGGIDRCGPCPVCGGRDRFSINIRKQVFCCRPSGGGDVIAMVQHLDGCGFQAAVQLLAGERAAPTAAPQAVSVDSKSSAVEEYEQEQHRKAAWIFSRRQPIRETPAEIYLRKARGIGSALPPTLAYLPPLKPEHHPALIAAYGVPGEPEPGIIGEPPNVAAVHLILLTADGAGKADCKRNKLTVGSPAGMPIVVAPMNDLMGLAICEGIEDALSVHEATGLAAWAAGGAPFLPKLVDAVCAAGPECVTIFIDDDDDGRKYGRDLAAALAALRRFDVLVGEAGK